MYITRALEKEILKASKNYPVILVTGPRQVGKYTMLYHIKSETRKYVSFDDFSVRRLAEEDPDLFFETYGYPLIIDEFQKVPKILEKIKDIVDKLSYVGKDNNGLFWLSGSKTLKTMENITKSFPGRCAIFELPPLSQAELNNEPDSLFLPYIDELKKKKVYNTSVSEIYEKIFRGGLPKILTTDVDREKYYSDYITTYLERDIYGLEGVGKLNDFYNFLCFMAARTSQELHYDEISKTLGISAPTAKAWTQILERSGIIYILHPYYENITNRLVKTPKVYFMDTGLVCHLCRWPNAAVLSSGNMDGAILENFVISEIIKNYLNHGLSTHELCYYRDIDKVEIDLLIARNDEIIPIEIKKNIVPNHPDKNFYVLDKFNKKVLPGLIFCLSKEVLPYNKKCWYIPIGIL